MKAQALQTTRSKRRGVLSLTAFLLLVVSFGSDASACLCKQPPPALVAFERADRVFTGRVLHRITHDPSASIECVFDVTHLFKGVERKQVSVWTGRSACGYPFRDGEEYLVYARFSTDGHMSTDICSRTALVDGADEEIRGIGLYARRFAAAPDSDAVRIVINRTRDRRRRLPPEDSFDRPDTVVSAASARRFDPVFQAASAEVIRMFGSPEIQDRELATNLVSYVQIPDADLRARLISCFDDSIDVALAATAAYASLIKIDSRFGDSLIPVLNDRSPRRARMAAHTFGVLGGRAGPWRRHLEELEADPRFGQEIRWALTRIPAER